MSTTVSPGMRALLLQRAAAVAALETTLASLQSQLQAHYEALLAAVDGVVNDRAARLSVGGSSCASDPGGVDVELALVPDLRPAFFPLGSVVGAVAGAGHAAVPTPVSEAAASAPELEPFQVPLPEPQETPPAYSGGPLELMGVAGFRNFDFNDDMTDGLRVIVSASLRRIVTISDVQAMLSFYEIADDGTFPRLGTLGGRGQGLHQFNFPEYYHAR